MDVSNVRDWVSSIPAISRHTGVNAENYRLSVRSYTYDNQSTANTTKNTKGGYSFITNESDTITVQKTLKTLVSSDNAYTKEDAIIAQWNKQGSFCLFDVMEGKAQVPIQNPNPSTDELKEFEKMLQKNGISKEIDWSNIQFDLKGIGFDKEGAAYSVKGENFNRKTEYITSRYAAVCYKINQNYTGTEREKQIEKLNTIYQNSLEEIAKSYTNIVGNFLEENGMNEEKTKVYQSVIESANAKATEYQKYLSENNDFLGISGTKDAWLLDDDEYIAARLREQNIAEPKEKEQSNYSLKDLEVLGEYVSSMSKWENGMTYKMDEERIGLDIAMMAMKTDTLQKSTKTSSNFNQMLSKLVDNFTNHFLDKMDKALEQQRKNSLVYDREKGFQKLDHQSVWNVYNKTMQCYKENGDAIKALVKGAEFAIAQRDSHSYKMSETYRYRNSSSYWNDFFDKDVTTNAYEEGSSTYQKYLTGWVDFENSLQSGTTVKMNIDLCSDKSNDFYTIAKQV